MTELVCACLGGLALVFAAGVVSFQNPVRGMLALTGAIGAAAAAIGLLAGAHVVGVALWLGVTSSGLLLYLALLLNLSKEERGARRFSLRRTFSILVVAAVFSSTLAILLEVSPSATPTRGVSGAALAAALGGPLSVLGLLAILTVVASVLAALVIARRRS